jgi:alpha-D-ribose 1-methylphosphonate 5-triphosphate synthase subunit PhnH
MNSSTEALELHHELPDALQEVLSHISAPTGMPRSEVFPPAQSRAPHPSQRTFRAVLHALSEPGTLRPVVDAESGWSIGPAGISVLLALLDSDTSVWMSSEIDLTVRQALRFHTGASLASTPIVADVVLLAGPEELPPLNRFAFGSSLRPESGSTVLIHVADFDSGPEVQLSGPGIECIHTFSPAGFSIELWNTVIEQRGEFPQGVDLLLFTETDIVGIPRSTRIKVAN